ncbi:MAG: hypothetical protein KC615_21975 [Anaerolineae bacterium]|nr:hypothetical protein [Anaerolineae bacterium]MCA9895676.1 hypothetical protein [Anaerolineae bacterium]
MSINIDWGNVEETILVIKPTLRWTDEDYHREIPLLLEAIQSKPYPVDLIIDLRQVMHNPPNLINICRDARIRFKDLDNLIVVISNNRFWQTLNNTVIRQMPSITINVFFTRSVDEAYRAVEEIQKTRDYPFDDDSRAPAH